MCTISHSNFPTHIFIMLVALKPCKLKNRYFHERYSNSNNILKFSIYNTFPDMMYNINKLEKVLCDYWICYKKEWKYFSKGLSIKNIKRREELIPLIAKILKHKEAQPKKVRALGFGIAVTWIIS